MRPGKSEGPATTVQSLIWDNRCLKAAPTAFQHLFEEAMVCLEGERFTPIRPYGDEGDRKADGVLDGGEVVYQVYSPNDLTLSKVKGKVDDDLPGAVEKWSDVIRRWVFVYNRRVARGLAPQVVSLLNDYQEEYPDIEIDQLHDGDLWRRIRDELSPAEREELVGSVSGDWSGVFVPANNDGDAYSDEIAESRVVLLQPRDHPIDPSSIMAALEPEVPFGPPYRLERRFDLGWEAEAALQREEVEELIDRTGGQCSRLAVFSFAPIPLTVHLGSVLTDRLDVALFQYHRDEGSWTWWSAEEAPDRASSLQVEGVPDEPTPGVRDIGLRVSLSDFVTDADVESVLPTDAAQIYLTVPDPDRLWLRHRGQFRELQEAFRSTWKRISRRFPDAERIHVFYAGPTPGAIALGRTHNPRMHPLLLLYEYDRNASPRYERVLTIGE